ncbi:MAG TPA: hypothetical protein VEC35_04345 [Noviherbaspirillum sp.]|nr:hypothetical protein [Noviherbaspirillum sp.]
MTSMRPFLVAMLLLLGAAGARASDEVALQDGEWMSYRDAYKQMIRFEKYGKPKQLIQSHFQVVPKDRNSSLDGVRLTLAGPSAQLNLPLDPAGRAIFPFLKSAYDDNARLVLNRKANLFEMQQRVSIAPRADGTYEVADLRAACEQVLDYLRHVGKPAMQEKKCAGVRFSFARQGVDPAIRLRGAEHAPQLAVEEGSAFPGDAGPLFQTVSYRFADAAAKGQLVTQGTPVAIAAEFR